MNTDRFSSLAWLVIGLAIIVHSHGLGIGTLADPGSGFIFFCSGLMIGIMALLIFTCSPGKGSLERPFENVNWGKVILVLFFILMYGIFLEDLGFLLSTFLLVGALLATIERKRWYTVLIVALCGALGTYAIFELWLHTRVPRGIFGF